MELKKSLKNVLELQQREKELLNENSNLKKTTEEFRTKWSAGRSTITQLKEQQQKLKSNAESMSTVLQNERQAQEREVGTF